MTLLSIVGQVGGLDSRSTFNLFFTALTNIFTAFLYVFVSSLDFFSWTQVDISQIFNTKMMSTASYTQPGRCHGTFTRVDECAREGIGLCVNELYCGYCSCGGYWESVICLTRLWQLWWILGVPNVCVKLRGWSGVKVSGALESGAKLADCRGRTVVACATFAEGVTDCILK